MAQVADDEGHSALLARGGSLTPGMKVLIHGDTAFERDELVARATAAGLKVVTTTRGRVDLLVVADPDGSVERALWARENHVRVVIEPVFLALLTDLEVAGLAAAGPPSATPSAAEPAEEPATNLPAPLQLQPDQNIPLTELLEGNRLRLQLTWQAPPGIDTDVIAFLTSGGRAGADQDMVFYNQPAHPSGGATLRGKAFTGSIASDSLDLELAAVPADIDRIVLAASLDGPPRVTFATITWCALAVVDPATARPVVEFRVPTTGDTAAVTALVAAEVYRHRGAWKLRALGQGYAAGLGALVTDYGIDVNDA